MTKIHKKISSFLAAALLFSASTTMNAQTPGQVLWGAGSTNTTADSIGRFVNLSTSNNNIYGWTSLNYTTVSGTIRAQWQASNNTNSSFSSIDANYGLTSASTADGMAFFNSDYYYNTYGVYPQRAALRIDTPFSLAGYESTPLVVKFNTSIYEFDSDSTHLVFSINGGASWPIAINIKDIVGISTNDFFTGTVTIPISSYLTGVTDLSSCALGFVFQGDSYHWIIDDVRIEVAPEHDLTISGPTTGLTFADGFTTARVANAYIQPLNQVSADEYMMGARVYNNGSVDIPVSLNPRINLIIERDNNGTWTQEFSHSLPLDTIVPAYGRVFNYEFLEDLPNPWVPTQEGTYRATYSVEHDGVDATPTGDQSTHYFEIGDNVGIYSKVQLANDGYPYASNATGGDLAEVGISTGFEWGSMYSFPKGSEVILDSVSIRAFSSSNRASSFTSGDISIRVYEFNDYNNDGLDEDPSINNELLLVGIGNVSITNTSEGLKSGKTIITNVVDASALQLEDNKVYLVTMAQDNNNGLVNTNGQYTSFAYAFDQELDYGFQFPLMSATPSVLRLTERVGNTNTTKWYGAGFGSKSMPSIMLHLTDTVVAVNETININNLSIYPNPASSQLNIAIDLEQASDVQYIITDVSGRIVHILNKSNVQNEVVTFNINDLVSGVYTISVKSSKGVSIDKFIKQ